MDESPITQDILKEEKMIFLQYQSDLCREEEHWRLKSRVFGYKARDRTLPFSTDNPKLTYGGIM
jgi:hypothetical protein